MLIAALLAAAQPGATPPAAAEEVHPCAPRLVMTAGGPPPAIFYARRIEAGRHVHLSVHDCGEDTYRVERHVAGPGEAREPLQWVPTAQCAAIGGWIQAATRLRLPPPMLRPHAEPTGARTGPTFTLNARMLTGPGWLGHLELQSQEPPGAPPSALSFWFREGERLFKQCRDQGHGGEGYAPRFRRPRPGR